ncbi:MAG: biotin/lipoyl-containing protein [Candidatus Avilachnospira sp.]|jgi:biotin carboxyl carrier protein
MKNYTITVNGNVYNVTVEEGQAASAPVAAPAAPAATAAPKAAAPAPAKPAAAAGGVKVEAPMSGKILAVKVSVGQAVKRGDVLLVLEAMKMENDIVAPQDGTVASVNCAAGDQVESGALLASLN